ncbi:IS1 family transposase [Flavobacterium sp. GSP27]|uniref:IS1 family transposase n=1 Tax=Flavobacterium bomense TaxID=2497483 RepID=A0A432CR73_9FLAO|nr:MULTISPECIES: helix-turn-helix domain-containing protein [Flavobacterium]RTY96092.1 IS1 family transposase [Flavobacterium sp. GSN2]RTY71511.1 IS1 family transposase [Flavobacterium sp. LB2P53]RTY76618.1 IS1 family transposase [Flavobacterium sp. LS1R10]RTY81799.1 IS1 family transposase [Flavobacterium sp. ZB4P23]RTY84158.1 IS1 family transposase [Flavobacterium sp. LS1P28]
MEILSCPKCQNNQIIKSGIINSKQRYLCKKCKYFFTVNKIGKKIDDYYVTKALQLYLEGLSFREIERILGVSHVTISNWVKSFNIKKPSHANYHPTYKIFSHLELVEYLKNKQLLSGAGMIITELGDKFMLIKWERFKD